MTLIELYTVIIHNKKGDFCDFVTFIELYTVIIHNRKRGFLRFCDIT